MNLEMRASGNRIAWVDIAKGITMLLVIVAHTMQGGVAGSLVRGVIYSFHMPLFFILSGFTMRMSETAGQFMKKTFKSAKALLVPGVLLYFAWIVIELCRDAGNFMVSEFWTGKLLTLLFASASSTLWGETFIAGIGMIWFFFVLFFGKLLHDGIYLWLYRLFHQEKDVAENVGKETDATENAGKKTDSAYDGSLKKVKVVMSLVSLLLAGAGMLFGHFRWLPFSLDVSLGIQPFFVMGLWLKDYNLKKKNLMHDFILLAAWLVTFYMTYPHWENWTYLEVGLRRYSLFPISYLAAFLGTLLVLKLSLLFAQRGVLLRLFSFLGKNSIYLLCIHIMDQLWDFIWYQEGRQFVSMGLRLISDLVLFALVMSVTSFIRRHRSG